MTVDPMAAVTSATESVAGPAAGADPAASQSSISSEQSGSQIRVADQDNSVHLFDYTSQPENKAPAIETLQPESKAKYLSNPAALGEQVLQRMESLHHRSLEYRDKLSQPSTQTTDSNGQAMEGPARQHVAGSATASNGKGYDHLTLMFDYALETTMISSSSSQFVSAVNTLMRGQ